MAGFARINTNVQALNALNNLNNVNNKLAMHQMRMTTGKQINNPSDNPAGWTIATKLSTRADGLGQALTNINSSKDMIAVAEGHLQNIQGILEEMRVKAGEAANDTLGTDERNAIGDELYNLAEQINLEVDQAEWNDQAILSTATGATGGGKFNLQISAGTASSDSLAFDIAENSSISTGGSDGFSVGGGSASAALFTIASGTLNATGFQAEVSSQSEAQEFMTKIDTAVDDISESLSYTGAVTNRLTYQETSLTTAQTRTEAARSTIEDADMASEQLQSTKLQILQQTATSMLSQANMAPQNILGLFGGGG